MSVPITPTPAAVVLDDQVSGQLTAEPEMVIRIANRLRYDVFDVEASLRRLTARGVAVRHPSTPGVPVMWSQVQR